MKSIARPYTKIWPTQYSHVIFSLHHLFVISTVKAPTWEVSMHLPRRLMPCHQEACLLVFFFLKIMYLWHNLSYLNSGDEVNLCTFTSNPHLLYNIRYTTATFCLFMYFTIIGFFFFVNKRIVKWNLNEFFFLW